MAINTKWNTKQRQLMEKVWRKIGKQRKLYQQWHLLDMEISILKTQVDKLSSIKNDNK